MTIDIYLYYLLNITIIHKEDIVDISEGVMEIVFNKAAYLSLHEMSVGQHLDFPDNTFVDAVTMGVFTIGHAPPESFDELIRITEPGGYIIFSVRADVYLEKGFKERQKILEKEGKCRLIEKTEPFQGLPLEDSEILNRIFVYNVL